MSVYCWASLLWDAVKVLGISLILLRLVYQLFKGGSRRLALV